MKKYDVKIIALDLDDTLLKSDLTIGDFTVEALQKAAKAGIYIVLCSGRTEDAILPYVRRLDIAGMQTGRYIIAQNGATIYDMHRREVVYSRTVEPDVLTEAYHAAKAKGLSSEVYTPSTIYAPHDNEWVRLDTELSGLKLGIVEDYENFLQKGFPKMVIPGKPEELLILQDELKAHFGERAVIFTSKPYFLEVLPANCGKGEALKYLSEEVLKIEQGKTMAFGDSMNDESMIKYAAHSTAMLNGLEYIKQIAAHVTDFTHDQDGVGHFVADYVL